MSKVLTGAVIASLAVSWVIMLGATGLTVFEGIQTSLIGMALLLTVLITVAFRLARLTAEVRDAIKEQQKDGLG